ncbi:MAG TPA: trigger factor, partial [Spirochaetia bacterium]|nr:trigger factor [Spirochaetia bacterium]
VDAEITKDAESQNKTLEEVKSEYNKNNLLGYIRENIITRKLYDLLLDNSTIKKGEKVKFLDFMQGKR